MTEQEAIETLQDMHDVAECRIKSGDNRGVIYIPEEELASFGIAIKALEEIQKYRSIGTPDECREAVEKQKTDKELESHDEKHILESCIALMREMVNEFAEWYRWQHGEDAIKELDDEERFCIRKTYFRIVQELFLIRTNHSGGTSTRAKCKQLNVDWGEEIEFDWSDEL